MLKLAARFGVSSSYMARACTLPNVRRPERSYRAKLEVGKAPKQPPLPEPRPGNRLAWTRDGTLPKRARSLPDLPIGALGGSARYGHRCQIHIRR